MYVDLYPLYGWSLVQYICTSSTMYIYDGDGGLCKNSLLFPNIGCYYFDSSFTVI